MKVFIDENGKWHLLTEEIVRCKDCKYGVEIPKGNYGCEHIHASKYLHGGDWFCADGERK